MVISSGFTWTFVPSSLTQPLLPLSSHGPGLPRPLLNPRALFPAVRYIGQALHFCPTPAWDCGHGSTKTLVQKGIGQDGTPPPPGNEAQTPDGGSKEWQLALKMSH